MAVTFASAGYGGAVTQESWAALAPDMGHTYAIEGADSWKATTAVGDRAIAISPGVGFGYGVRDKTVASESIFIPAVTSGTVRYDLIVARRNWATKSTSFVVVTGTSERSLPANESAPGFLDDQPLWLVRVNSGSTVIGELVDLRVWSTDGGMVARDALARLYLGHLGARVRIGGETWTYDYISPTMTDWVNEDGSGPWVTLVRESAWKANGPEPRARLVGRGAFVHVQADVFFSGSGGIREGWIMARLPAGMQPKEGTFVPGTTDSYTKAGIYMVNVNGLVVGPNPIGITCQLNGIAPLK